MQNILIVDDSELDRSVLKIIFEDEYNVIEAENGYRALEILNSQNIHIDFMVLDINMPGLGGFEVLNLLDKFKHAGMKIMLISSEAQKDNIIKAANFGVSGFFKKPFDSEQILSKLREIAYKEQTNPSQTGDKVTVKEVEATRIYADRLRRVYLTYLKNSNKNDALYLRVSEIVHIMLETYFAQKSPRDLTPETIEIISQAAYFFDIGRMIVKDEKFEVHSQSEIDMIPKTHTIAGADFVSVNTSKNVSFFVKVCSDICMHHHERFDGRGMPHGLKDSINNIYTQICSLAIEFCTAFFSVDSHTRDSFSATMLTVLEDQAAFRPDVIELLQDSRDKIVSRYSG